MIIRSSFLNTAAFLLAPPDDTRSAAQIERDGIAIGDSTNGREPEKEEEEKEVVEKEEVEEEEKEEGDEDDDKEEAEGEEEKPADETDEQKTARVAKEKEARREARVQKRIDKAVANEKAAKTELEALRKQIAEKPVEGLSEEEVERRAEAKAAEKLTKKQQEANQTAFNDMCDKLEAEAKKFDKDFSAKVVAFVEDMGKPIPGIAMHIAEDLDNKNGGEVLNYLINNVDEAEEIFDLPERQMTQKLIRLSDKLKEAKKPAGKQRSNVPPPINAVNEGRADKTNGALTGNEDMETFMRKRNAQVEERRKQRGY